MTDPLDILIGHLQGLAEQIDIALSAARALQGQVDSQPPTRQPDIRDDDLIDTKVAERRFGVPDDTIRSWCRQKGIGVKPAGRWLVSVSALRAELRRRQTHHRV